MAMRKWLVAGSVAAVLMTLAACGSSETTSSEGGSGGGSEGGNVVADAKAAVDTNYAGTDRAFPDSAPTPPADLNVWVIACSMSAEGCAAPAQGFAEAGKALGWSVNLVDGKLDPATYNASIRSAVAAGADAVVLASVDCSVTKASLEAAKKAGVLVGGLYGLDCDDKYAGGGDKLFDFELKYQDGQTYGEYMSGTYAKSIADYVIAKTDGKADVIAMLENDVAIVRHIGDGFVEQMKRCETCTVTPVEFTGADFLSGGLQAKTQTALTQNPSASVVFSPYDAAVTLGIAAGVKSSGRDKDILLTGGEGLTPNIAMIASGSGQDFAAGAPARWAGWAVADELIRATAGEPMVDEGIGIQSMDADHLPEGPAYDGNPGTDYETQYRRIWGLS